MCLQAKYGDDAAKQIAARRQREAELAAGGEDANLIPLGVRVSSRECGCAAAPNCLRKVRARAAERSASAAALCCERHGRGGASPADARRSPLVALLPPPPPGRPHPCCCLPTPVRACLPQGEGGAKPAAALELIPDVEWWDARILPEKSYGGVIDGEPAQVGVSSRCIGGCRQGENVGVFSGGPVWLRLQANMLAG